MHDTHAINIFFSQSTKKNWKKFCKVVEWLELSRPSRDCQKNRGDNSHLSFSHTSDTEQNIYYF